MDRIGRMCGLNRIQSCKSCSSCRRFALVGAKPQCQIFGLTRGASRVDLYRIQRFSCGEEKRFPVIAPETQICRSFGHEYFPDASAVRSKDVHTVASARPHASVLIHSNAIRTAFVDGAENAAVAHRTLRANIEYADVTRRARVRHK